jgi:hypothetical protein
MTKMNLFTTFTPSHRCLYENYFLKTLPDEFNLHVIEDDKQHCKTGSFYQEGWDKTCYKICVNIKSFHTNFLPLDT